VEAVSDTERNEQEMALRQISGAEALGRKIQVWAHTQFGEAWTLQACRDLAGWIVEDARDTIFAKNIDRVEVITAQTDKLIDAMKTLHDINHPECSSCHGIG